MARKLWQLAHFISVFKYFIAAVYSRNKGIRNTDYCYGQNIYLMSGIFSLKMANIAFMMKFESTISYIYISHPGIVIVFNIDHYR